MYHVCMYVAVVVVVVWLALLQKLDGYTRVREIDLGNISVALATGADHALAREGYEHR